MSEDTTTTTKKPVEEKKRGSYDHSDHHTSIYSANGVSAVDNEIDKAWARLHDAGHVAGPAVGKPFMVNEYEERQHFQYAWASRDVRPSNVNKTVVFHFPHAISESGL